MKKLALLLALGLLAACGGGTTASTTQPATFSSDSGQLQMATTSFTVADAEAKTQPKTLALGDQADFKNPSNQLRIIISNPNIRVNNIAFKNISTYPIPLPPLSYTLPVAPGYKIEAISYRKTTVPGFNRLKRFGSATFEMTKDGSNPAAVTITPTPIDTKIGFAQYSTTPLANLTAYATTNPSYKNSYNISVTGRSAPLGSSWKFVQESADIILRNTYVGTNVNTDLLVALTTPQSFSGGTLYALGEFYLDSFYLKEGESPTNFTYVYPNRYWNDPAVSQTYGVPPAGTGGGGFSIGGTW